jgi:proteasome lid subunit RPN8/RPN11
MLITSEVVQLMFAESEAAYPDECCGFLFGSLAPDGTRHLRESLPVANARREGERQRRFQIAAEDFLRAEQEAVKRGLELLGIYHSHPDHPSVPSDYDREHALPFYTYAIVAVAQGRAAKLDAWALRDDRSGFDAVAYSVN